MNPVEALLHSEAGLLVVLPIALALLTLIIFVHEAGHYYFLQRFGIHVRVFAIGLPPRLWSRFRGGERLPVQPLGNPGRRRVDGPLRLMPGDPDPASQRGAISVIEGERSLLRLDLEQAAANGAAGAVVISDDVEAVSAASQAVRGLPVVVIGSGAGRSVLERLERTQTTAEIQVHDADDAQARPRTATLRLDGTRFAINALPLGGYVLLTGETDDFDAPGSFARRPPWQRAVVLLAGPLMNFLLAPFLFLAASLIADVAGAEIRAVVPGSPAAEAGLSVGDRIARIGGHEIRSQRDVSDAIGALAGRSIELEVVRGGEPLIVRAVPRTNPPEGEGPLGIQIGAVIEPAPIQVAIPRALERTGQAIVLLPMAIGNAIAGTQDIQLSGPVGIVDAVGQAARQGPEVVFFLAALLTAQIGLINLVPWPGLDGGRLVFVAIEGLTGRRLSPRREAAANFVGVMLLLSLAVVLTVSDIQRLFSF